MFFRLHAFSPCLPMALRSWSLKTCCGFSRHVFASGQAAKSSATGGFPSARFCRCAAFRACVLRLRTARQHFQNYACIPPRNVVYYPPLTWLGVAQFGSVLEWGSRGRRFKSSHPDEENLETEALRGFCLAKTKNRTSLTLRMAAARIAPAIFLPHVCASIHSPSDPVGCFSKTPAARSVHPPANPPFLENHRIPPCQKAQHCNPPVLKENSHCCSPCAAKGPSLDFWAKKMHAVMQRKTGGNKHDVRLDC